jgi:hypothetical protein
MNIALITSTIAPSPDVLSLKSVDSDSRFLQYRAALEFYLNILKYSQYLDKILYVDNSGYDLSELVLCVDEQGLQEHVEFISYRSDIDSSENGRFFLEINLIDHAFSSSELIKEFPQAMCWKISGRYIINNFEKILRACSKSQGCPAFFNCRNLPNRWTDFFLAGFTSDFYSEFIKDRLSLFEGNTNGEVVLRGMLDHSSSELKIKKRLPVTPFITGTRGYDGASYSSGKNLVKYYIRSVCNRVLPFVWM